MTVNGATPYVFTGFQAGNAQWDPVDGPNPDWPSGVRYGGGFNSCTDLSGNFYPERYTEIAQGWWNQKLVRHTTVFDGGGGVPGPNTSAADVIDATYEALAAGLIVLLESHDFTGDEVAPSGSSTQPTPGSNGPADSWTNALIFWDALMAEFANNSAVWFNFMNEPATGLGGTAYWMNQATWWLERARLFHNASNICVFDLNNWGQDLYGLGAGQYDTWWNNMAAHSSGDLTANVVFGWHAYGARAWQGGYTYATMDADIQAVKAKGYPMMVVEYGEACEPGTGNAGDDQWNRDAVTFLATNQAGQALALKHNLLMCVWHATGDATSWHAYKLVEGSQPQINGDSYPVWDVTAPSDPLERLGTAHKLISV